MRSNLHVEDERIEQQRQTFLSGCAQMEDHLASYIKVLTGVTEYAVIVGDTSDALKRFCSVVGEMTGKMTELSETVDVTLEMFVHSIDEADQYLY